MRQASAGPVTGRGRTNATPPCCTRSRAGRSLQREQCAWGRVLVDLFAWTGRSAAPPQHVPAGTSHRREVLPGSREVRGARRDDIPESVKRLRCGASRCRPHRCRKCLGATWCLARGGVRRAVSRPPGSPRVESRAGSSRSSHRARDRALARPCRVGRSADTSSTSSWARGNAARSASADEAAVTATKATVTAKATRATATARRCPRGAGEERPERQQSQHRGHDDQRLPTVVPRASTAGRRRKWRPPSAPRAAATPAGASAAPPRAATTAPKRPPRRTQPHAPPIGLALLVSERIESRGSQTLARFRSTGMARSVHRSSHPRPG